MVKADAMPPMVEDEEKATAAVAPPVRPVLPAICTINFATSKASQLQPRGKSSSRRWQIGNSRTARAKVSLKPADLRALTEITQVEDKFLVMRSNSELDGHPGGVVLIVDQHAASERVELERLQQEILIGKKLQMEAVHGPGTTLSLVSEERRWLQKHRAFVEGWGFRWRAGAVEDEVVVTHAPNILGTFLAPKDMKGVISSAEASHVGGKASVPPVILHILTFKACRRAIKFGDHLNEVQMRRLMKELSKCDFPFQCAHGRPTVYPLASLAQLENRGRLTSTSSTACGSVRSFFS